MSILFEIKDNKSSTLLNVLSKFFYVKINSFTKTKAEILQSIKKAANKLPLARKEKLKAKNI